MIICHTLENTCEKNPESWDIWHDTVLFQKGLDARKGRFPASSGHVKYWQITRTQNATEDIIRIQDHIMKPTLFIFCHFGLFVCSTNTEPSYVLSSATVTRSSGPNKWTKAWNVITSITWHSVLWLCSTGHYAIIIYVWDKRVLRVKVSTNINYIRTTGINWEWSRPTRESGHPDFNTKISQNK